jgi:hypothetical protein
MVIHWDEVEGVTTDLGERQGTWRRGRAAGTIGVGANRVEQVDPWDGEA